MRSLGWAPNQYDWCPNKDRKFRDTDTQGRVPREGEGRDRGGASTSRGKSETYQPTTSSWESGLGQIPLTASEGTHPSNTLILDFQPLEL